MSNFQDDFLGFHDALLTIVLEEVNTETLRDASPERTNDCTQTLTPLMSITDDAKVTTSIRPGTQGVHDVHPLKGGLVANPQSQYDTKKGVT